MTEKQIAQFYIVYWNFDHENQNYTLSMNTPADYYRFAATLLKDSPGGFVHKAMQFLVDGKEITPPGLPVILKWANDYPKATEQIDHILNLKVPPKTFQELAEKAYKQEVIRNIDQFREFFKSKLTSNT